MDEASTRDLDRGGTGRVPAPAGASAHQALLATLPVTERRLELAGISTAVLEGGNGPPVVLLHGPGGYAAHWLRVIPALVTGNRVLTPDLPGHGESTLDAGSLDADRVLTWLGAVIDETCASVPTLVGETLGGAVAARFTARHGARVKRLVLIDTFGLRRFAPTQAFGHALHAFVAAPSEDTHDLLWQQCAFDAEGLEPRMGQRWKPLAAYNLDRARTPSVMAAMQALMQAFGAQAIVPDELGRIAVPTTLVWGRRRAHLSLQHPPNTPFFIPSGVQYALETYRGGFLVTDGHHNRVLRITRDGTVSESITFDNIVPTGLAVSGAKVYVAEAGPVPHLPGDGKVVKYRPRSATAKEVAAGASLLVDVEFGRGHCLYALSQGHFPPDAPEGSPAEPNTGALVRVHRTDGTFSVVAERLNQPTSLEFIGDTAYVVSLAGDIWKIDGVGDCTDEASAADE